MNSNEVSENAYRARSIGKYCIVIGDNSVAYDDWCLSLGHNNSVRRSTGHAIAIGNDITITDETEPVVIDEDAYKFGVFYSAKYDGSKIISAWFFNSEKFNNFCNKIEDFYKDGTGEKVRRIFSLTKENIISTFNAQELELYELCIGITQYEMCDKLKEVYPNIPLSYN